MRGIARALALAGALASVTTSAAQARVRDVWVAAVPTWWNIVPNCHDAIMGMPVDRAEAIFPTGPGTSGHEKALRSDTAAAINGFSS